MGLAVVVAAVTGLLVWPADEDAASEVVAVRTTTTSSTTSSSTTTSTSTSTSTTITTAAAVPPVVVPPPTAPVRVVAPPPPPASATTTTTVAPSTTTSTSSTVPESSADVDARDDKGVVNGDRVAVAVLRNDLPRAGMLDPKTLRVEIQPPVGITRVQEDGRIYYQGPPNVRFWYRICSTTGGCGYAAVTIYPAA